MYSNEATMLKKYNIKTTFIQITTVLHHIVISSNILSNNWQTLLSNTYRKRDSKDKNTKARYIYIL